MLRGPDGVWVSGRELASRSARAAGRLAALGLVPGDRVVMSCRTSLDLVVAHVACLRYGLVVVPTNTAYTAPELYHVLADARPSLVIADRPVAAGGVPVLGPELAAADGPVPELDAVAPDSPALLGYTSGTTGRPKGAVLTHANLLASARALVAAWRWTSDDRLLLCLPLFHMHGLGVGLHGTLLAGASAVLLDGFSVDAVLMAAPDATMFFGVPTMYARLADAPDLGALRGLRLLVSGSAPLDADLHRHIEARCGQRVLERYGMTETVMLVSNPYDGERRAGTVGFALPGVEIRLGEGDEIEVRGPNVFGAYWERPEATAAAFRSGWFATGDVGRFDADGYLSIVGRTKELIISGGFNVYPREVEDVVRTFPGIRDVAIAGTPDPRWGEIVTAYVEADQPIDAEGLLTWTAGSLAPYKRPRRVVVVAALPRNSLGKVVRSQLADCRPIH
jgi:malonyl-CoA/methylmalonyl-CoA synthetase